jgi:pimeloyl-ACP methyl ester carboxylesterase
MKSIVVDGVRLEYQWHGPLPLLAPTLVFLHEGLGCAAMWRDFPERLARACGCGALVYSRAGYGGSDPVSLPRPLTYMHDEGERVLPQVLAAMSVRQAILIGHSDGASIALIHAGSARAHPGLLGLVLEAPHVFCEEISVRAIAEAGATFESSSLKSKLERWHGTNTECAFWGWNRAWLDPGFREWNIESYLPRINVPLLLVQSENDPYGTLAQLDAIERGATAAGSVERVLLADCGHSPHREQPEATFAAMEKWIRARLG